MARGRRRSLRPRLHKVTVSSGATVTPPIANSQQQVTAMARKQYPLRIDPAIWEAVQRWADDEMRSANGQVEWILRDALKRAGRLPKKGAADAPKPPKAQ